MGTKTAPLPCSGQVLTVLDEATVLNRTSAGPEREFTYPYQIPSLSAADIPSEQVIVGDRRPFDRESLLGPGDVHVSAGRRRYGTCPLYRQSLRLRILLVTAIDLSCII